MEDSEPVHRSASPHPFSESGGKVIDNIVPDIVAYAGHNAQG
jgi:hypothetical protein